MTTYKLVQGGKVLREGIEDYRDAVALRDALETAARGLVTQAIDIEEEEGR